MGKMTDALKKASDERQEKIERIEKRGRMKFEFIARKTIDSNIDPKIVSFYEPSSTVSEQYRKLRTNIQALGSKQAVKVFTVTSSTHSEGKSITCINLAISMAHDLHKKNIVLIDADMRRGKLAKYLGIAGETGLSDILSSEDMDIQDALINIGVENLTVIPAGKFPHNPAELLGSPRLKAFIAALRQKFDYIIFDAPPVIPVTDSGLLGAQTDGVIMVVQANRTQKRVVRHSEGLLRQAHAKILGYVLTNIQYHIPGYIYRYL